MNCATKKSSPIQWRISAIIVICAEILFLAGCNYILPASYIIEGPPKAPASFELPSKRTVVIVDDKVNRMPRVALRVVIGDSVGTELLENSVVPETISTRDAVALIRRMDSASKPVSIQRICESLGAEQVVYVEVDEFNLVGGREEGGPEAVALVKVLDITNVSRLWPTVGFEAVQSSLQDINPSLITTSAGRREIEDKLAEKLGQDVAKLFYAHERRELGGRLGVKK
ncbi:MAG: hypothetical protein O2875_06000 [Planctomycetota bacterium]|nr:hypothetical protein [Planctomycetota bacterium]MDA1263238.1 hypothetical protein [Planctomycetota bacterium]